MADLERRKFLRLSLKLLATSSALAATYPLQSLYAEKVRPMLIEKNPEKLIPEKIDFSLMNSLVPQILASSVIMTFIMMYADSLQSILTILIAAASLFLIGIPVTEHALSLFVS